MPGLARFATETLDVNLFTLSIASLLVELATTVYQ